MNMTVNDLANALTELLLRHPEAAHCSVAVETVFDDPKTGCETTTDDLRTVDLRLDAGYLYLSSKPSKTLREIAGWDIDENRVIVVGGNAYAICDTTVMTAPVFQDTNQPDHTQWSEMDKQYGVWADTVRQAIAYMPE